MTDASSPTDRGVFRARGKLSAAVVGAYAVLLVLAGLLVRNATANSWAPWLLGGLIVFFLARYLSTSYRIDDRQLRAFRILGGRTIPLAEIRRIEYSALRDLSPTGMFGGWGWRGRMWSPSIGRFDAIHTDAAAGLLVTASSEPLYLSPRDPAGFARELSRRVRSYTGPLAVDVGSPESSRSAPAL